MRSTASAARPYGATSGLAIAKRVDAAAPSSKRARPSSRSSTSSGDPFGAKIDEAADRVDHAGIAGQAGAGQLIRELLVGGEKHLERRAVLDLPRQRAGRAEHQFHALALARELFGDLRQREVEIGRGGDRRRALRGDPRS